MQTTSDQDARLFRRLRWLTAFFILGLVLSGATAIPLETELNWIVGWMGVYEHTPTPLDQWLLRVTDALHDMNIRYPFMAYGGDWLAFGHFMIALVFVWAWREPVRHRWLFDYGLVACALVIPFAMFFGAARGIPFWWRMVDCSFGIFGAMPLWLCRRWAAELAAR